MKFDWLSFLKKHHIPHSIGGKDVSRGNIGLKCPFCKEKNDKTHLGIDPDTGYWNCWKCNARGRTATKLVQALIHCSYTEALQITNEAVQVDLSELDSVLLGLSQPRTHISDNALTPTIEFPKNFHKISNTESFRPYYNYMCTRKFELKDVLSVIDYYDLRCAITGYFSGRVIVPIYFKGLVGWTGRAISKNAGLRYLNLSSSKEQEGFPLAPLNINKTLFLYDKWEPQDEILIVCEGPFDALKVDYYGKDYGVRATCTYTANGTETQQYLLTELANQFKHIYIMYDNEYYMNAYKLSNKIMGENITALEMPTGIKDPGDMTKKDVLNLISTLA